MPQPQLQRRLAPPLPPARQVEKKKGDAKREGEAVRAEQRTREVCQRRLNRAELEAHQLGEQLPGLQAAVASMAAALVGEREAEREAREAARLQEEVAGMVGQVAAERKLVRRGWGMECWAAQHAWQHTGPPPPIGPAGVLTMHLPGYTD